MLYSTWTIKCLISPVLRIGDILYTDKWLTCVFVTVDKCEPFSWLMMAFSFKYVTFCFYFSLKSCTFSISINSEDVYFMRSFVRTLQTRRFCESVLNKIDLPASIIKSRSSIHLIFFFPFPQCEYCFLSDRVLLFYCIRKGKSSETFSSLLFE